MVCPLHLLQINWIIFLQIFLCALHQNLIKISYFFDIKGSIFEKFLQEMIIKIFTLFYFPNVDVVVDGL